jgi:5-methylcytosine-specific restriction endonuclease McrA
MLGRPLTDEHKKKISNSLKGRLKSAEYKKKLSAACMGKKGTNNGKHFSEEHKQKIRDSHSGEKSVNWKGGPRRPDRIEHLRALKRISESKRRAKKKNAGGTFTLGEWETIKRQYGSRCPMCGKVEPEIKLTIDHVIPLAKGGAHCAENIQPLCLRCNTTKQTTIYRLSPKGEVLLF